MSLRTHMRVHTYIQTYENNNDFPIETFYKYPVYPVASLVGVTAKTDEFELHCVVKEKEEAKQEYNEAVKNGDQAVLVLNESEELYDIKIGNIKPHQEITITMVYLCELKYDKQHRGYKLILPTTITPRYDPNVGGLAMNGNEKLTGNITKIESLGNDPVTGIETLKIEVTKEHPTSSSATYTDKVSYNISNIDIFVNLCTDVDGVECISHDVAVTESDSESEGDFTMVTDILGEQRDGYAFNMTNVVPDKDVVIIIKTDIEATKSYAYREGNTMKVRLNIPPEQYKDENDNEAEEPIENIFVLDQSGSMMETQIGPACRIIKDMIFNLKRDVDYFNYYRFGSTFQKIFEQSKLIDIDTITKVVSFINENERNSLGGTETYAVLANIFDTPKPVGITRRNIVIVTDGEISNIDEVVKLCTRDSNTRIFTIGIGNSISHHFVNALSKQSNGCSMVITTSDLENNKENIIGKSREMLLDMCRGLVDVDYFIDDRKLASDKMGSLMGINKYFDVDYVCKEVKIVVNKRKFVIPIVRLNSGLSPMRRFYHKQIINDLESSTYYTYNPDSEKKKKLIALSTKYSILTRYTSFIGVVRLNNKQTGTETIVVPLQQVQKYNNSITTGALQVAGGVGICQNVYIGGNASSNYSRSNTGSLIVAGGLGICGNTLIGGNNTPSTCSLQVCGGIGRCLSVSNNYSPMTTGSLIVNGGLGICRDLYVGSNDSKTCYLTDSDGICKDVEIGIKKNLCVGGNLYIGDNYSCSYAGAIVCSSGIGIGKILLVGGKCEYDWNKSLYNRVSSIYVRMNIYLQNWYYELINNSVAEVLEFTEGSYITLECQTRPEENGRYIITFTKPNDNDKYYTATTNDGKEIYLKLDKGEGVF